MGYSAVAIPDILRENSGKAEYNKKRLAAGRSSETHGKGEGAGVKIIHSSVMVMKIMNYLFGGETLYCNGLRESAGDPNLRNVCG